MNYLYSTLEKQQYLTAMKQRFDSPFRIFDGRVTGFVIGSFFAVANYQPYEWNRRITSECNRAYGFVKEVDGELEICFLRSWGLFSPLWLVFYTLFCKLICVICEVRNSFDLGTAGWWLSIALSIFICGITAFQSAVTENGQEVLREVNQLLQNPEEYY